MMREGPDTLPRRHEIDALRSIALILLIGYHVLAAYQPFAKGIEFIPSPSFLEGIWFIGELMNSWRIPVLFLISGLTAGYLLQNRSVRALLKSRLLRLMPPIVLTFIAIAPISGILFRAHTHQEFKWIPTPGHLWFVWNLVAYFILSAPFFHYLKKRPESLLLRIGRAIHPTSWIIVFFIVLGLVVLVLEPFARGELFTAHFLRFWSGLTCFLFGVLLVSLGDVFWAGIRRVIVPALLLFLALYLSRMLGIGISSGWGGGLLKVLESVCGMLAFVSGGSILYSRPSRVFSQFNRAVFPVYILHLPIQQALSFWLFGLELNIWLIFALHVALTLALSILIYRVVVLPLPWLHLWFGIPSNPFRDPSLPPEIGETVPPVPLTMKFGRVMAFYVIGPLITLASLGLAVFLTVSTFGQSDGELLEFIEKEMKSEERSVIE